MVLAGRDMAIAAPEDGPVDLVVGAGRPLRVALAARVRVKRVGQPITATVVEPVYAYDRIVIPAGAKVVGSIERLDRPSTRARWLGILQLDFSPARPLALRFEKLVLPDGEEMPITTRVGPGMGNMVLSSSAPGKKDPGTRAAEAAKEKARQAVSGIRGRGKWRRFKDAALARLPFHAQYVREGTVYDAELLEAVKFGATAAAPLAPEGASAPPDAVLHARLVTALGSARTPRGTKVEAVLTVPLFSAERQLILPEGTAIEGEVTFARAARHFRRNGRLRLLFETARVAEKGSTSLLASLYAAEVSGGNRLSIDEEGGASMTNSSTRFVGPALAAGAVAASLAMELAIEPGEIEPGVLPGTMEPNSLGTASGGFSGLGLLGIGLSQISRPTAVGLGVVGLARSVYGSVIGKGREVSFPTGTRIQVQLAPPRSSSPAVEPAAP